MVSVMRFEIELKDRYTKIDLNFFNVLTSKLKSICANKVSNLNVNRFDNSEYAVFGFSVII